MVFNRVSKSKKGYDAASRYDPAAMARIADADADADAVADAEEPESSVEEVDPETEVLDRQLDAAHEDEGLDISSMRKGGMTPGDRRRRCRTVALCLLGAATAAGAVVGIALGARKVREGGGVGGIHVGVGSSSPGSGGLVPPPSDLSRRCSPVAVSTERGWDECESACAAAECCLLPQGHWFSCKAGNEEDCSAYEYSCMTLDHVENLQERAKKEKDGGGAGGGGDGGGGSVDVNDLKSVLIPPAPANLADVCDPKKLATADGFNDCQEWCEGASCCKGWEKDNVECAPSNPDVCSAYEPCDVLDGTPASHPEAIASQAKVKCNTQALSTPEGVEECQDFCHEAMCCFADLSVESPDGQGSVSGPGIAEDCTSEETGEWCGQYAACQGLLQVKGAGGFESQAEAKEAVDRACSAGFRECKNICDPAECCFRSADEYCLATGLEELLCDHYASCETLYVTTVEPDYVDGKVLMNIATAPGDLDMTCSSPRPDDVRKCYGACEPAHCCDERIEICKVTDPLACDAYFKPCRDTWEKMPDEVVVASAPHDIADLCLSGQGTPQTSDACAAVCERAECCVEHIEECRVLNPDECFRYEMYCQAVWTEPGDLIELRDPPEWIEEQCKADSMSEQCQSGCRESVCCDNVVPCGTLVVDGKVCEAYEEAGCSTAWAMLEANYTGPVEVNHQDLGLEKVHIPEAPADLKKSCGSKAPDDEKNCHEACRGALCCDQMSSQCAPLNPDACQLYYFHCVVHWASIEEEVHIPEAPADLKKSCGSKAPDDEKKCHEACRGALCCDQTGRQCAPFNPDECQPYYFHCIVHWASIVTIPALPADIDDHCKEGMGQSASDKKKCQEYCDAARCCREDGDDCRDLTNPELCGVYQDHCHLLWKDDGYDIPAPPGNLGQVCSALSLSTSKGAAACKDACGPADCCADPEDGCANARNPEMCSRYEACSALSEAELDKNEPADNAVTVPDPPTNLADICSSKSLSTAGGHNHCTATCDAAQCCNLPIEECRVLNPDVCKSYEPCGPLYVKNAGDYSGFVEIPPAPADINEICSSDSLLTVRGFTQCEDVCGRARCCEEKVDECNVENPAVCDGYYACSFLYVDGGAFDDQDQATLMELTEQVSDACAPTKLWSPQGLSHCQHLCNDRLCCFEKEEKYSCLEDKECVVFAPCENLVTYGYSAPPSEGSSTKIPPEAMVDKVCHGDALKTVAGINACMDMCSPYLCCFSENKEENCYSDRREVCDGYGACLNAVKPPEAAPPSEPTDAAEPKQDKSEEEITEEIVKEACSPTSIGTAEGLSNCHSLCGPRMCCFVRLGQQSNCVDALGGECMIYGACSVLADVGDDVYVIGEDDPEADAVNDSCSYASFETEEGRLRCVDLCSQRSCCFAQGPGSCYETDTKWCDAFEACEITNTYRSDGEDLPDDDDDEGNLGDDESGASVDINAMKTEISSLCMHDSLQSEVGMGSCKNACDPHSCCWDQKKQCYDKNKPECEAFEGCGQLYDFLAEEEENAPEKLCTREAIASPGGRDACEKKCGERGCCWVDSRAGNCYEEKPGWCDEFRKCMILGVDPQPQQGTSNATKVEEDHPSQLCTADKMATESGRDACRNKCDERACCWLGDCNERKPDWCAEYKACLILDKDKDKDSQQGTSNGSTGSQQGTPNDELQQGSDNTEPVTLDSELERICSAAGIAEDNGEACQRLCKPQSCCFATDKLYNCWDEQPVLCKEFEPCETLYKKESDRGGSQSQIPPKAEVEEACNRNYSLDPRNCQMLCEDAKCCFTEDPSLSCRGMKSFCGEYAPCEKVFMT